MKFNLKKIPKNIWILIAIIAVAIFLRTYEFRDWMVFERDQVRDAMLVSEVIEKKETWPLLGPTMKNSQDREGNLFQLGPAYYHMQIISAKIFGNQPDKLAYPDLLFSILAIPLLYIFFRKIFNINIALILVGIFSVSFYAIEYARFAWNPNPIPFFAILFILSLYEMATKKEKIEWFWLVFCGISIGIGIQLHIIILILFPITAFFVFVYLLQNNWRIWNKIAMVFLVVIVLNSSQLVSEFRTSFSNFKIFLNSVVLSDLKSSKNIGSQIGENLDCHIEANIHILASSNNEKCGFYLGKILQNDKSKKLQKEIWKPEFILYVILISVFSLVGYAFLFYRTWKEGDRERRIFLYIIMLYAILSFAIMIPVITSNNTEFRYFIHTLFIPYLLLGFGLEYFFKKHSLKFLPIALLIALPLIASNLFFIRQEFLELSKKDKSNDHFCVLGEVEEMTRHLILNSNNNKEIYLDGKKNYLSTVSRAMNYLAQKEGISIINVSDKEIPENAPLFYLTYVPEKSPETIIKDRQVRSSQIFGEIIIYELEN